MPEGETRQEISEARTIRAQHLVSGCTSAEIAAIIHDQCGPVFGTTWIRAYRLALGIALTDVVAQVRARYAAEGRTPPRFSETQLSAYENAQKRPGPEYLHYLCAVYHADPQDLGYQGPCFCGSRHASDRGDLRGSRDGHLHSDRHGRLRGGDPGEEAVGAHRGEDAIGAIAGPGSGSLRTGPDSNAATFTMPDHAAVGTGGPRGVTAGRRAALRPVPEPRDSIDAAVVGLPPGMAAAVGGSRPVTLVPPAVWGADLETGGDADDDTLRRALLQLIAGQGIAAGNAVDGRFFGAVRPHSPPDGRRAARRECLGHHARPVGRHDGRLRQAISERRPIAAAV